MSDHARGRRAALGVAVWAACAAWTACIGGCGGARGAGGSGRPLALVLPALDGGEIDLAAYRGKIVVLHLFTTWSLGAQGDIPQLSQVHGAHPDTVEVIGVALDKDGYRLVAPWRNSNGIRYLVALGDDALAAGGSPVGRVTTVPTTLVLDRRGAIARRFDRPLRPGELDPVVSALGARR